MVTKSLNASGLTLLKVEKQPGTPAEATVFATEKGIEKLRKKIEDFGGDLPVNRTEASSRRRTPTWCKALARFLRRGFAPCGAVLAAGFRPSPTNRLGKCGSARRRRPAS
ncbi:hypothetical protein BMJ23_25400 [Sinorhizobium medicae]|nr:hypothetical protein BMJ23_25400 [Sinorhizobium medicae]